MGRVVFMVAALFGIFSHISLQKKPAFQQIETLDLGDAIKKKLIDVSFVSNGSYSGNSLVCKAKNLQAKAYKIRIPEGTFFQAPSDDEQSLLVPQSDYFLLQANQAKSVTLNGFCTNASKKAPTENGSFKLSAYTANTKMPTLLAHLKGKKYDNSTLQDAIWAITNGHQVSNVVGEDKTTITDLRKFLFTLTGQKETWYESPQIRSIEPDRSINFETARITGDLSYRTTQDAKVYSEVFSPEGEVTFKTNTRTIEMTGELTYNFKVEVKGWKKGKYQVRVMENNKLIKAFEFIV